MSISGNSFFDNPDFEFYQGDDSLDAERSDLSSNNLVLSFWSQNVVSSKSLGGTVKIYTNGFLPEGVLEMTYTLFERSVSNLTYTNKDDEQNELITINQSFKRHKNGKVAPSATGDDESRRNKFAALNESQIRLNSTKLTTYYTMLTEKPGKTDRENIEYQPIVSSDTTNPKVIGFSKNILGSNSLEIQTEKDQDMLLITNSIADLKFSKDLPNNINEASSQTLKDTTKGDSRAMNSSPPFDNSKIIYTKRKDVFKLKTSIERSALLIIPFKIFFKDKTLLNSIDETYLFEGQSQQNQTSVSESLSLRIVHLIEFRFKGLKEDSNSEIENPMKDKQIFFLHPDYDAMNPQCFERKMKIPSRGFCLKRIFNFKENEIKIQLDRTVLVKKNFNSNLTVSYPKTIIKEYSKIKIVLYQRYYSMANPDNYKSKPILSEELNLLKEFVSPKLKTLEFVYRIPFEKISDFNLQSANVS
jgi:hypothetical protein